ncbi:MAG: hypothetical protein ACT4PV_06385 [Planctomycetaceae bacterium]
MDPAPLACFAGATAALAAACVVYFRGRFSASALLGALYAGLMVLPARSGLGTGPGSVLLALFLGLPALFLLLHIIDLRRGLFLVPTVYAIPCVFFGDAALWIATILGLAW